MPYTDTQLTEKLEKGILEFMSESGYMLGTNQYGPDNKTLERASERSITHRIAAYLQKSFPEHHVDCEYNRNVHSPKEIEIEFQDRMRRDRIKIIQRLKKLQIDAGVAEAAAQAAAEILAEEERIVISYPDIIVHQRLDNTENLMIVEVKCKDDSRGAEGIRFDMIKLRAFTQEPYNYQLGIFLEISEKDYRLEFVRRPEQ